MAARSRANTAPVSAYGPVRSTSARVSGHLAAGYTCTVSTGPKISSHIVWYIGSSTWSRVGSTNQPIESSLPPPATTLTPAACLARSRCARMRSKARLSITAPMKLRKSATSPMRMSAIMAVARSRTSGQSVSGMYAREAALHFWP